MKTRKTASSGLCGSPWARKRPSNRYTVNQRVVDMDALQLMGGEDLREAEVPLGLRIKLLKSGICRDERRCDTPHESFRGSVTLRRRGKSTVQRVSEEYPAKTRWLIFRM